MYKFNEFVVLSIQTIRANNRQVSIRKFLYLETKGLTAEHRQVLKSYVLSL